MESGDDPSDRSNGNGFRPIRGMESVIATVSGYHGTERFKLIKLIAHAGASYVGALTKSTTHLVCRQFEGKKYNMARTTGAHIISHRWFEDCLKEGKRLPENSYSMERQAINTDCTFLFCIFFFSSGQEAGPITWEVPVLLDVSGKGKCIRSAEQSLLCDNSNALDCRKTVDGTRYQNLPESDLVNKQKESNPFPNLCSSSNKRTLYDAKQDDAGGSVRRTRRLRKAYCDLSNYIAQGKTQEICVKKCEGQPKFIDLDPAHENSSRNRPEQVSGGFLGDNITTDCNALCDGSIFSDNDHCEHATEPFGSSKIGLEDIECYKEDDNIDESGAHKKSDVSCVICWTDFCTARAVLPCGHRFCYSCIQGWANCMASKEKASTCPLCKASFKDIRKFEDASTDQKIYSQTIPYGSSNMEKFVFPHEGNEDERTRKPLDSACYECHYHEPQDLLLCCNICQSQWVHSHCLYSPMFPWTCIHCRDLRTLYRLFR